MNFEYYPDEIAEALASVANENSAETIQGATEALYQLKAICENKYNSDCWRTFYRLLEKAAGNIGVTIPF